MKNALWNRGSYFKGNPNKSEPPTPPLTESIFANRTRHPIMGSPYPYSFTGFYYISDPVYDKTTGSVLTRSQLLSLPFFYPGTFEKVPSEVCAWAAGKEANISISWNGISASEQGVLVGYAYGRDIDDEVRKRFPEEDYDKIGVYLPGDPVAAPSEKFPFPAIFSTFNTDDLEFSYEGPASTALKGGVAYLSSPAGDGSFFPTSSQRKFDVSEYESNPGETGEIQEVDTGIPLGDSTYKLKYTVTIGQSYKSISFESGGGLGANLGGIYLAFYKAWAAPIFGGGSYFLFNKSTEIIRDAVYDSLSAEYGGLFAQIEQELQADDSTTYEESIPIGADRISQFPIEEGSTYYSRFVGSATVNAQVTKQLDRFFPGQVGP